MFGSLPLNMKNVCHLSDSRKLKIGSQSRRGWGQVKGDGLVAGGRLYLQNNQSKKGLEAWVKW
jgi:hypothetical protein